MDGDLSVGLEIISIPCSDDTSNILKQNDTEIWTTIITKRDEDYKQLNEFLKLREPEIKVPPHPEVQYLENKVFPILLPILEKALIKAKLMESLRGQRNLFNGIDFIAECLWNTNNKYPERLEKPLNIYLMPWVQEYLIENPRKLFPLSWILNMPTAATMIQSFLRGYFVRRREEVQEMRQFWKTLQQERCYTRRTIQI